MIEKTIFWKDNQVAMIDQRKLPHKYEIITCTTYLEVIKAIKSMAIRGAPAIGIAAAYGMALAARKAKAKRKSTFLNELKKAKEALSLSRPTAINLCWALEKVWNTVVHSDEKVEVLKELILQKAEELAEQDININFQIGQKGSLLFKDGDNILTHCNAGSLATVFYGTALGVIRAVYKTKKNIKVYVNETRPVLQGARLTAWELKYEKIPFTLICDSVAGFLMNLKKIDKVIVGADRIAANGDVANKIGTYSISVLAKNHNIPFYVAAPISTIDHNIEKGADIPIEERDPQEVTHILGKRIAPENISVYNPAFDITPAENISAIITEYGLLKPPYKKAISNFLSKNSK